MTLGLFQQKTAWSAQTTHDPNIFVTEPGLLYPSSVGFNGSLLFQLNNGFEVEIPNEELQHPVRGLNQNGARVLQNNVTEMNIYAQAAPLDSAVLGKAFLSKVPFVGRQALSTIASNSLSQSRSTCSSTLPRSNSGSPI